MENAKFTMDMLKRYGSLQLQLQRMFLDDLEDNPENAHFSITPEGDIMGIALGDGDFAQGIFEGIYEEDECEDEIKAFGANEYDGTMIPNIAFLGSDYITIRRKDAKNILDILECIITDTGKSDKELWGEKGISFERLYDRYNGMIYERALDIFASDLVHAHNLEWDEDEEDES